MIGNHHKNGLLIYPGPDGSLARSGFRSLRLSISEIYIYFFNLFLFPPLHNPSPLGNPSSGMRIYEFSSGGVIGGGRSGRLITRSNQTIREDLSVNHDRESSRSKYARGSYVSSHPSLRLRLPPLPNLLGLERQHLSSSTLTVSSSLTRTNTLVSRI